MQFMLDQIAFSLERSDYGVLHSIPVGSPQSLPTPTTLP